MSIVGNLERPHHFTGRHLPAKELAPEPRCLLDRARRHDRFLHGWGVASGLEVSLGSQCEVPVGAGMTIDCAGNEIVAPSAPVPAGRPSPTTRACDPQSPDRA